MTNHPNRSAWIEGKFFDRGDGSIGYISYSRRHPGVARLHVAYYATGRGDDYTVYCAESDLSYGFVRSGGQSYRTLAAAARTIG